MKRFLGIALVTAALAPLGGPARADEPDAKAVLDKGIQALGGEEKLGKAGALSWKSKGTLTFSGDDNEFSGTTTTQGLDHYRVDFEGEFNGNEFHGVTVLDGAKGWRKLGDNVMDLDGEALARERRTVYLQLVPVLLVPLKGKDFKVESAGEEKVGDKPAAKLKVTGPDAKTFTLSFDKESGLPVKLVASVPGFQGDEFEQTTTFANYKDVDGIKGLGRNKVYNWPPPSIIGLWTPIRNWNANSSRSSPASTRGSVASLLPPRPEPSATAGSAASAGPPAFLVSRSRGRWRSWIPRVRTPTESAVPGAAARSSVTPRRNCSRPWRS